YPDVVIQEIAKRLDYGTIKSMKLTNSRLRSALLDPLLWMDLCARDHRTIPSRKFRNSLAENAVLFRDEDRFGKLDYERIWAKDPFRSNLAPPILSSIEAMRREYGWRLDDVGHCHHPTLPHVRMLVEEPPRGCEPHPEVQRCIATSIFWGTRLMRVNLIKEGFSEWVLDHIRPRIIISELVAPRPECSSIYRIHAQLLKPGERFGSYTAPSRYRAEEKEWPQENPGRWERVELVFEDYPTGMREIGVLSEGKDRGIWGGNFGAKYANLQIRIEMPDEARWLSEEDFNDSPDITWQDQAAANVTRAKVWNRHRKEYI
ncbi:hypothetical protein PFISCL1PPCAC_25891, partial [Pristionchus fissidentatus]